MAEEQDKEQIDYTSILHKAKEKMGISKAKLLLHQPFYGVLMSMLDCFPEKSIPTMATDGKNIYYNPEYCLSISDDEVIGVILHEVSHCVYMHLSPQRRLNRDKRRWNFATDYVINLEIKNMGYSLPENILYDHKFSNMNAEQVYDLLNEENTAKCETLDFHIYNEDVDWDDMEDKVITSYEIAKSGDSFGNMPESIKRFIDRIRKSRVKWERVFHKYIGQALSKDDYSYTRINKRCVGQGIFLPDLRSKKIGNVVVAVDTSGSITKEIIEQFAGELAKVSYLVSEVTVITCDAAVHEVVKINNFKEFLSKIKFSGGGGTDFRPVFEEVKNKKIIPELLIYLTDCFGTFGEKPPQYPVLWCCTEEDGMQHVPWGQKVLIPKK